MEVDVSSPVSVSRNLKYGYPHVCSSAAGVSYSHSLVSYQIWHESERTDNFTSSAEPLFCNMLSPAVTMKVNAWISQT